MKKKVSEYKTKSFEFADPLSTASGKVAFNMEQSLEIPTATSYREIPIKVLDENRKIINNHIEKVLFKKISFTHMIAWAIVKSLIRYPNMNSAFEVINEKPHRLIRKSINFGVAVDLVRKDGTRMLMVPNMKDVDKMTFSQFVEEYDNLVFKARNNRLDANDLSDTTITLTNPGMIGTSYSSPRLMKGQGLIAGIGAIDFPSEFRAVRPSVLSEIAISKVVTISSTYDHRIIQGAESAEFLQYIDKLLTGNERFYEQLFYSLDVPFEPFKWTLDSITSLHDINDQAEKNAHIIQMINAYRVRGHLLASTNPLGRVAYYYPELDPSYYGFTLWDLDRTYHVEDAWDKNNMTLREVLELLRDSYCGQSSIEFMHIQTSERKEWIKKYFENARSNYKTDVPKKLKLLYRLIESETFENFMHTKFIGTKRFSLEGGESLIPLIDEIFQNSLSSGLNTIVMGMSHRGRLNVVANNLQKDLQIIFKEFEGDPESESYTGSGDVKYHLGFKNTFSSESGNNLNVILASNPSHLEIVDPVVEGMARAISNQINDKNYNEVLPILIHGDSSFAGQGVVMETLNLSELEGYKTGGTIHIIVNNQIGFTTNSLESRSTTYTTDVAKMIQAPILHVNGNNPEAVSWVADFAFKYRQMFGSDVIIDLLCYRKYGHNEADEPTYTQPLLYKKIRAMEPISRVYAKQLEKSKVINTADYDNMKKSIIEKLETEFQKYKSIEKNFVFQGFSDINTPTSLMKEVETRIEREVLNQITERITLYPKKFNLNPKLKVLLDKRNKMVFGDKSEIDWAMAEHLAFGSIVREGKLVRLTGQDSQRGTFSQRHAVLIDFLNEDPYVPLNNITENQAQFIVYDSPLSEYAVVGFEYGYSIIEEKGLTLWEAQFGDFANNAIPVVDQFLSCGESKWAQFSNLVLLLPHSYDGQGPEHSSARPERYLQLCAEENMIVANISTPANYFHALRRQVQLPKRVPLIIMTPKGLLRHPLAVSSVNEFTDNNFITVYDDKVNDPSKIEKVIFMTGKIYYELLSEKNKRNLENTALIRIEQLYPLDEEKIKEIIGKCNNAKKFIWFQEEPKNQGYWNHLAMEFSELLPEGKKIEYYGRPASPATATGSAKVHAAEQQLIIDKVLS
jgi:2-oxoglutarate dehydrogenase E1 component